MSIEPVPNNMCDLFVYVMPNNMFTCMIFFVYVNNLVVANNMCDLFVYVINLAMLNLYEE